MHATVSKHKSVSRYPARALEMIRSRYGRAVEAMKMGGTAVGTENRGQSARRLLNAQFTRPCHGLDVCGLY